MTTEQMRAWLLERGYSRRFNERIESMPSNQVEAIYFRIMRDETQPPPTPRKALAGPVYHQDTLF